MDRTTPQSLDAVLSRSRTAVARAVSAVENNRPGAAQLLAELAPHLGHAHVVGVTGSPGAGKSTLINALLGELVRRGRHVAVVAVDPSSPISGGAILGDRVRMGEHGADDKVFIRSVSARGHLGGLSRTTGRIIDVFDAAGYDVVIVETVGAGQSEVEVSRFADTNVVVCPPGLGDDVQAIKAGILEIADILVVNKADLAHAARTVTDLKTMLHLRKRSAWQAPVLRTVATSAEGITQLVDKIDEHGTMSGRGRRLHGVAPSPLNTDDVAAVDRTLESLRESERFDARPVTAGAIGALVEAAARAHDLVDIEIHALAGGLLAGRDAENHGATAALLLTSGAQRDVCALLHALRVAAQARGIASRAGTPAPVWRELAGLPASSQICAVLLLGYAAAHGVPGAGAGVTLTLHGFG